MIKAIIFDLDGTIADSVGCIVETVHIVEDTLSIPRVSDEQIRWMIGRPLSAIFTELHALEGELLERAIKIYKRDYVKMTKIHERLFDGAIEVLEALKNHGLLLAIATGKNQTGAENACERLEISSYFDSIHGVLPGTPGKPHPAILHRVMQALDVSPDECILVGDTTHDMELATAAGVFALGVNWGVHSLEVLTNSGVEVVTNMVDLQRRLLSLSQKSVDMNLGL